MRPACGISSPSSFFIAPLSRSSGPFLANKASSHPTRSASKRHCKSTRSCRCWTSWSASTGYLITSSLCECSRSQTCLFAYLFPCSIFQAGIMHLAAAASSSEDEAARGRVLLHQVRSITRCLQVGLMLLLSASHGSIKLAARTPCHRRIRQSYAVCTRWARRNCGQLITSTRSWPVAEGHERLLRFQVRHSTLTDKPTHVKTDFMFEIAGQPGGSTPLPSGQLVDFNLLQNFLSDVPFTLPLSSDDILWNNFTSEYSDLFVDPTAQPTDML
jgi:hypothetical protein